MTRICNLWSNAGVLWKNANWKWSECQIATELVQLYTGVDASRIQEELLWRNEPEKRKRLIKLICKVKKEEYSEEKEKRDEIRININDIKLVVKSVLDIELILYGKYLLSTRQ